MAAGDWALVEAGGLAAVGWLPEELAAWEMPELVPSKEWAERHVRIPGEDNALPGPVSLDLTPYLRGILDAFDDPTIEIITIVSGTQLGKTTVFDVMMLSATCQRPGPVLIVLPIEPDAREIAGGTLKNLVRECAPAMALCPDGEKSLTKEGYEFAGAKWYFGWSNSAASLARRACRYVFYDEVEKFPPFVGRESNPLRLGDARLRTFRNTVGVKSVRTSSPTTRDGLIARSYEASDQRHYHVPCPHCGTFQTLTWPNVRWPKDEQGHSADADTIRTDDLAWYVCGAAGCGKAWTDAQRIAAVRMGKWARAGEQVERDGRISGTPKKPRSNHAGFHISALYSPFVRMSQLAASWIEAQGDQAALMGFVNQELGEFWEEKEVEVVEDELRKHRDTPQRAEADAARIAYALGQAPQGVQVITCGVDVQKGYYYVEARGWGYGLENWMLDARQIETEEQLHDYLLLKRFPRIGAGGEDLTATSPAKWPPLAIRMALIDCRYDTSKVYELIDDWHDLDIRPVLGRDFMAGASKLDGQAIHRNRGKGGRAFRRTIFRWGFENLHWKNVAARLAQNPTPGPGYMHLPADTPDIWFAQFTSEKLVPDRSRGKRGRSGRPMRIWKTSHENAANHYWDCAVINTLATDEQLLNLRRLPDPATPPPAAQDEGGGYVERFRRRR